MTGASLGFGKTLLSASYNIILMSVITSMYDPRAPTLAAVAEEKKLSVMRKNCTIWERITKKGRAHLSYNESGSI